MTNTPIGIPSGWEEIAAYWHQDYLVDCLYEEIGNPGAWINVYDTELGEMYNWRVVE